MAQKKQHSEPEEPVQDITTNGIGRIERRNIADEMQTAYLDYAMSVIVGRALPDIRDGLKPVHRRILYSMWQTGLRSSAKFKKCASVVGDVLVKYHPHGDSAVYDSLVRMAQDFSMRYPLIRGQGNFGSLDGDPAAAYRYTEAKLETISEELLVDIEKETVDFIPNFDGTHKEPKVLPAKLPNLLINGTVGIAGGMAYSNADIKTALATGRGGVVVRGKTDIVEDKKGNFAIIITEIPYQVNKANLLIRIAQNVRDKKIEGIKDLRDESTSAGVRVVVELKKDAYPKKVLNRLYQTTQLQESTHYNMLALVEGGILPRVLNLKMILEEYLKHRQEVVKRRTQFELTRALDRAHILEGLRIALAQIDKIIACIKKSKDKEEARLNLIKQFKLSERQAVAILDMRLQQLANLETLRIEQEYAEKMALIKELESILASAKKMMMVIAEEVEGLKLKYASPRRTQIIKSGIKEFSIEDVVPDTETVVMITKAGYIKRIDPDTFRTQKRGGKGVVGMASKDEDEVEQVFSTTTHKDLLFFTSRGRVFQLKAYDVPEASRIAKGQALVNFLQLAPGESVSASLSMDELADSKYLLMGTNKGTIKKTDLSEYDSVRKSGLISIKLRDGDNLQWVRPTSGKDQIMLVTSGGQAVRFEEKGVRPMGRVASGVRGIKLKGDDSVVGMGIIPGSSSKKPGEKDILVVMENGYGKRSDLIEYKVQGRGGSGIKTANISKKTGKIVAAHIVDTKDERDMFIISGAGQVIRSELKSVSVHGRATQGVRIMRFKKPDDTVASAALI